MRGKLRNIASVGQSLQATENELAEKLRLLEDGELTEELQQKVTDYQREAEVVQADADRVLSQVSLQEAIWTHWCSGNWGGGDDTGLVIVVTKTMGSFFASQTIEAVP